MKSLGLQKGSSVMVVPLLFPVVHANCVNVNEYQCNIKYRERDLGLRWIEQIAISWEFHNRTASRRMSHLIEQKILLP